MAKLYLVRHGETDFNKTLRFQGQTDVPLNEKGKEQAQKMATYFRNIPLTAIYSSSLQRAYSTAEILGSVKNLAPVRVDSFREINFGQWEGGHSTVIKEQYGSVWEDFFKNPAIVKAPGARAWGTCKTGLSRRCKRSWLLTRKET